MHFLFQIIGQSLFLESDVSGRWNEKGVKLWAKNFWHSFRWENGGNLLRCWSIYGVEISVISSLSSNFVIKFLDEHSSKKMWIAWLPIEFVSASIVVVVDDICIDEWTWTIELVDTCMFCISMPKGVHWVLESVIIDGFVVSNMKENKVFLFLIMLPEYRYIFSIWSSLPYFLLSVVNCYWN